LSPRERDPHEWVYAAVLRDATGAPFDQSIWPLLPYRELALTPTEPTIRLLEDGQLEVSSTAFCHAVHVEDHGREVLSDNWLDLLPGVPVRVRLRAGLNPVGLSMETVLPRRCRNG
jgi:hypothetical protein